MKLYFARHGETESNRQMRVVSFDDPLTDLGRQQARELAGRVSGLNIDIILASPHKRAMETAQIVSEKIIKPIQEAPLLGEKKWPSEIEGKLLTNPEVEKVFDLLKEKNNSDPAWRYRDEENFLDIKKRADLFMDHVSKLPYENILAVSHEYFIKTVIASMAYGTHLPFEVFRDFFHATTLNNTSLTLCEKKQDVWSWRILESS